MKNFGTIFKYELKKIYGRKIVWLCFGFMLVLTLFGASERFIGDYTVNGEKISTSKERMLQDIEYEKALTGRKVDEVLLAETVDSFNKIPGRPEDYASQKEYQIYGRPYDAIYYYLTSNAGLTDAEARVWKPDMADFEARRLKGLEDSFKKYNLTKDEEEFWLAEDAKVGRPLTYAYAKGWQQLVSVAYSIDTFLMLVLSVCLSGVFSVEHSRKTDQLNLCSKNGKKQLYLAKILAGGTFAGSFALVITAVIFAAMLGIYGIDGFGAPIQLSRTVLPLPITVGQGALICYGLIVAAAIVVGMFVMLVSELTRSGVASLGVTFTLIVINIFFNIPEKYRILGQLYDYLPANIAAHWNAFGLATVPLFGRRLIACQAAPVLYAVLTVVMAAVGYFIYKRYQVSGR